MGTIVVDNGEGCMATWQFRDVALSILLEDGFIDMRPGLGQLHRRRRTCYCTFHQIGSDGSTIVKLMMVGICNPRETYSRMRGMEVSLGKCLARAGYDHKQRKVILESMMAAFRKQLRDIRRESYLTRQMKRVAISGGTE